MVPTCAARNKNFSSGFYDVKYFPRRLLEVFSYFDTWTVVNWHPEIPENFSMKLSKSQIEFFRLLDCLHDGPSCLPDSEYVLEGIIGTPSDQLTLISDLA